MNIFFALAEGRGRISETNLSAFTAFLLTPNRAHGLGESFLRAFLQWVANECGEPDRFQSILTSKRLNAEVGLEVRHTLNMIDRTVDVEIKLFESRPAGDGRELHRIIVENKIKSGAAQDAQFDDEFNCVLAEVDDGTPITAVFLTPDSRATGLQQEYDRLTLPTVGLHRKVWLRWTSGFSSGTGTSVTELVRDLLRREAAAEIEPVSEYTRHTLKAFVQFLNGMLASASPERAGVDPEDSEIVDEQLVTIGSDQFQLIRYENSTIKVYDQVTKQEVSAKPVLRDINTALSLGIDLCNSRGNNRNTLQLGRAIMDKLRERGT
ncbi:PD-(D/E)XK nuclease family protein [Undibacterium sp. Xuan67W]|uniref:PD-(D/E)XK nuclease family protein n=1 Tax=Undibacterium sp. Xuan67W TaxID=3413057 RepID=UPI003BEF8BCD